MIEIRKAKERGLTQTDWLHSQHSFSFGHYYDPKHRGFRHLRVINEDIVKPGQGFAPHAHQNMEIISYVLQGTLAHQDSIGNGSLIKPGEIQAMSAGAGIQHSEFNHSQETPVHFLQIWIEPREQDVAPRYQQFTLPQGLNEWLLIASGKAQENILHIQQDVDIYQANLEKGHSLDYALDKKRYAWLQLIQGEIRLNEQLMQTGDGAAITPEKIAIHSLSEQAVFLLFDLN